MFAVDSRIRAQSVLIGEEKLSNIYFKNDAHFPWLILVPRVSHIEEIYQLNQEDQTLLMMEVIKLSRIVQQYFKPDKLNIGSLGNIVSQLHVHIVARFKTDIAWPHSVWQANLSGENYRPDVLEKHVNALKSAL